MEHTCPHCGQPLGLVLVEHKGLYEFDLGLGAYEHVDDVEYLVRCQTCLKPVDQATLAKLIPQLESW